jgi:predicted component of type VI protein secretion system
MLRDGDRVEIGQTVIVYREGALPGRSAAAPARASGGAALLDDDDDDLFASAGPSGAAPVAPPTDEAVLGGDDELPASRAPSPSAPPPPPAADVVEFEDEVVEVQNVPPPRPEPAVEVRQAGRQASGAGAADPVQASSGRVLQYSKKKGGSGLLGDDLGQMSGGTKWLLVLLAVAAGGGVVYAIMSAMR